MSLESENATDLISLTALCKALSVSRPTAMNYIALGMPATTIADREKGVPWEFSLSECLEWVKEYDEAQQARRSQREQDQQEDAGIVKARIAKLNVETERLELRLSRERGELVPIDKVAEIVEGQFTTLRTHLLSLPIKLAPILVGHESEAIREKIDQYIREALQELAEDQVMSKVKPENVETVVSGGHAPHPLDVLLEIENEPDGSTTTN